MLTSSDPKTVVGLKNSFEFKGATLTAQEKEVATVLAEIHGSGVIVRKKNGECEMRLPDPKRLADGHFSELKSKHLYVNITKIANGTHTGACRSARDGTTYTYDELKAYLPLKARLPMLKQTNSIRVFDAREWLGDGQEVPEPGDVIPVTKLPTHHPAIAFLRDRGCTDLDMLFKRFEVSYCEKKNPVCWYSKLSENFDTSAEGCIVFYMRIGQQNIGWQRRRLEKTSEDGITSYWSAIKNKWVQIHKGDKLFYEAKTSTRPKKLLGTKYVLAPGMLAKVGIMGWNAAVKSGKDHIILVEGVLDAALLPENACSIQSNRISAEQAALVATKFKKVYFVPDRDEDPNLEKTFTDAMNQNFYEVGVVPKKLLLPHGVKDVGDCKNKPQIDFILSQISEP